MKKTPNTIISCALTGSVHTPTMSEALPYTPEEMIRQGTDAVAAGSAILHVHARDKKTGLPTPDPDVYGEFLPALADTGAVINITTGGSTRMALDDRLAAALRFRPELASLNMGSMNFDFSAPAARYKEWKFEWEYDWLVGSQDLVFVNTFRQIKHTLTELGAHGTRFEFECYDVGHLYTLAHFVDQGLVRTPMLIQCIFGVRGGIGADQENLSHMVTIADKLFGDTYYLSAFAAGRHQMDFVTASALHGGHVRVGLEDNLYIRRGELAESNADQVAKAARLLTELGREIATPDQARDLLQLKGRDATAI
ncbi:3-keto-5-aminohexanoate cleavage protein [Streptomyces sp. NRRL S-813]|uniref:3-keto-5-aminohexanoate cleavage protein n=1 Tax=Streptomyces sp. NRRL S-813 TaxID=1463919 RepID=UPI0004BEFF77|nr:3-keto-5-aminohexanoate cleavage protein [Streptomyces sp. NRRL S-813]